MEYEIVIHPFHITQIFAAYANNEFVGVLLAEMYAEEKKQNNLFQKVYVKFVDVIQKTFFKDGAGLYEETDIVLGMPSFFCYE